ncbi:MAG: maltose alpha-D-glucosyltransferase [Myxococcota bacterium]
MNKKGDDDGPLVDDPLWYKDAIIYELHVRSFFDSNNDGVGDFSGMVEKLDYLQDLGVTAIWLLPFYPSPLRDDGYDIGDYERINPSYGSMRDFKRFLREAHKRGLRVITELVINHTSNEHAWFQRARRAPPGSRWRNFYVWSDHPEKYQDARIIFQDFETSNWAWDPVAKAYYWHRFYHHQPDLNFESPDVQRAVTKVMDRWLEMGVDGLRLDAVPYLYEREGSNCENLPETHEFLKKLRKHIDDRHPNRMLLAEANQWPEDAAAYFGEGDECHMNFHFPVMPRMFMAVQLENSFPLVDILDQTPHIPDNCQWAVFLRNHDELTLEMVTDEDRDYMYRVYATDPQARINLGIRRRLAPLLKMRRKVELMNGLLFSLPGTPVLYYGDEIGMGDNIFLGDRDGVRTPMQWSPDRNAGFSKANPQRLFLPVVIDPEYHYESVNVEAQQNNPASLLWWMKRLIALRKTHPVLGRGSIHFLHPDNSKVLAFIRHRREERILCVFNLSRFAQYVELDLREFDGMVPLELFGLTEFPPIGELPYLLTLGPHAFYWFELTQPRPHEVEHEVRPTLEVSTSWTNVLRGKARGRLESSLAMWMPERRWFRGKARKVKSTELLDAIPLKGEGGEAQVLLVEAEYVDGGTETYVVPVGFVAGDEAQRLEEEHPEVVVCHLRIRNGEQGVLHDALATGHLSESLLRLFGRRKTVSGKEGQLRVSSTRAFRALRGDADADLTPRVMGAEQSNTSVAYGEQLILKIYRHLETGVNPDLEVTRYLSERAGFPHVPPVAGTLEYARPRGELASLGILQRFIPNQGDAWKTTLDALDRFLERSLMHAQQGEEAQLQNVPLVDRMRVEPPAEAREVIGPYLPFVELLGQRTAELHLALAGATENPDFVPEELSVLYQRSLYQSARTRMRQTFQQLRSKQRRLPEDVVDPVRELLARQAELDGRLKDIVGTKIEATRIRTHGDYHLGQVLYTGKDFVILDFEGEPARPITERRFKRSPLRDVSGMLRSFHYATVAALRHGRLRPEDAHVLEPWAEMWNAWVSATFLRAYVDTARGGGFLPEDETHFRVLLDFYLVDKCVYELGYELNNRPSWLPIPIQGLLFLLAHAEGET